MVHGVRRQRGLGLVDLDLVRVAVEPHEVVEQVPHQPRVAVELPEHVVDREVERVHHAVLALVHHPEGLPVDLEQLRRAVVAVGGVRDHEALVVGQRRRVELRVERLRGGHQRVGLVERRAQDVRQVLVVAGVEVAPVEPGGHRAFEIGADGQHHGVALARRHLEADARARSQQVHRVVALADAVGRRPAHEAERLRPRGLLRRREVEHLGGDARLAAEGEADAVLPSQVVGDHPRAGPRVVEREDAGLGLGPLGVVDDELRHDGRPQPVAHLLSARLLRIGDRAEGRVDREGHVPGAARCRCTSRSAARSPRA